MEKWNDGKMGKSTKKNESTGPILGLDVLYPLFQFSSIPTFQFFYSGIPTFLSSARRMFQWIEKKKISHQSS
jgi:hypothetical protein